MWTSLETSAHHVWRLRIAWSRRIFKTTSVGSTHTHDCSYKQPPKPQGKGKGSGKSKSRVTEISESDSSKQAEKTWTPCTSVPQSSLSQANDWMRRRGTLWIFSQEESQKRQPTVNWEDQSDCKTAEHELMIDSGCFGHVHPPWFAPQFPVVSFLPTHLWKESRLVMAGENATNDVGSLRQRWCRET